MLGSSAPARTARDAALVPLGFRPGTGRRGEAAAVRNGAIGGEPVESALGALGGLAGDAEPDEPVEQAGGVVGGEAEGLAERGGGERSGADAIMSIAAAAYESRRRPRGCQVFFVSRSRGLLYVVEGITDHGTSDEGRDY